MHKKRINALRTRRALAALACLVLMLGILSAAAPQKAFADSEEEKTLVVTVVEEIPVEEIEDDDVPLASFGDTGKGVPDGTRHTILAGALLLAVALYVVYFVAYEKRLGALREEAAEAESRWHARRRAKRGECS